MKYNYIIFFICLLLVACGTQSYSINMPTNIKPRAYTIWYSDEEINLALLAGLEQESAPTQEVKLGLVLLQGKRFAQCTYINNDIQCKLALNVPSAKMQSIVHDIAQIIAHNLRSTNPLPLYWEKSYSLEHKQIFKNNKNKSQLQVEENI